MSRVVIISGSLGAVLGGLLGVMGITLFMWQWWAVMGVAGGAVVMVSGMLNSLKGGVK